MSALVSVIICTHNPRVTPLGVAIAYFVISGTFEAMGNVNMLRPTLAAWGPLLIFVPVAAAMSQSLRT